MTKRTDVHRPSAINPTDYELAKPIEGLDWRSCGPYMDYGVPSRACDHCGHTIRWGVRFQHVPTGGFVVFGMDCADIVDLADDRIHYEMNQLKKRVRNLEKKMKLAKDAQERREEMERNYPEVVEVMNDIDPETEKNLFLLSLYNGYERFGSLTERQIQAVQKMIQKRAEWAAAKLAEVIPTELAPEGRQTVTGEIVKTKWQTSDFGDTLKMRVKLEDGNQVWGTVPQVLMHRDVLTGLKVTFSASFTRSEDHFSFYKRPSNLIVI